MKRRLIFVILLPIVTLSANSFLERQDVGAIISQLSNSGSQSAIAAAVNIGVIGSNEYTFSKLQLRLNDITKGVEGLEAYVKSLSSVSIPSDTQFCTVASNWVTYAATTKSSCTTVPERTQDVYCAYKFIKTITTPSSCSSKRRKRSIFEWAANIRQNTPNLSPFFHTLTKGLRRRQQVSSRPKQPFSKLVYSSMKNVVDKLWSNRLFQEMRHKFRENLHNQPKDKLYNNLPNLFPTLLGNRLRRQFGAISGSLLGNIANVGLGAGSLANTMTRKSAQETQLNDIKSRMAVLKLQVESLTNIKNNYLTGACAFAKSFDTELTTSTSTTDVLTEWKAVTNTGC